MDYICGLLHRSHALRFGFYAAWVVLLNCQSHFHEEVRVDGLFRYHNSTACLLMITQVDPCNMSFCGISSAAATDD
jgi:hypothetical protein